MVKVKDIINIVNCDLVILERVEGFRTIIVRISGSFVNQLDALLSEKLLNAEISSIEPGTGEQTDSNEMIFVCLKERVFGIKY